MRRILMSLAAAAVFATSLTAAPVFAAQPSPVLAFGSDTSWMAFSGNPLATGRSTYVGQAVDVCLSSYSPEGCPSGAVDYQDPWGWWGASLAALPTGSRWIWAPGVSGSTPEGVATTAWFEKTINLQGNDVSSATIYLAADNAGAVYVNGELAMAVGGDLSPAPADAYMDMHDALVPGYPGGKSLRAWVVPGHFFKRGNNTIVLAATNALNDDGSTYQSNPAGIVFGGVITLIGR